MRFVFQSNRRRALVGVARAATIVIAIVGGVDALAQTAWPAKPVKIIVPFAPGGTTDLLARAMATELSKAFPQPVIVENRAGAGGNLGADIVAKSPADGYTLLMGTVGTHGINKSLYSKMPFDPQKDFAPITLVAGVPNVMIMNAEAAKAKGIVTVKDFIKYAKANPGKLNYAAGTTFFHLAGELFKHATGTDIVAIPYNGTAPQVTAMLGNEVDVIFDAFLGLQHFKSGRFRALAGTSATRSSVLPDVPTLLEAGLKGVVVETWIGLFAPAGTPRQTVNLLNAEAAKIIASPDVRARLAALSYEPLNTSPEQFASQIARDTERWAQTVKDSNFTVKK